MRHVQIYRAIDAVSRHGSIRRAAAALSISPSALNRQILALEEEIGAPLFERLTRGVRLSTAGEIYVRAFRMHLSELERAASLVSDLSGLRSGSVRIGVGEELASHFLPSVVASHRAAYPQVDVVARSIRFDDAARALGAFEIDLAMAANVEINDAVETIHAEEARIVCVSAAGFEERNGSVDLSALVDAPLVVPTAASGLRNVIDALFAARRAPRRFAFEVERMSPGVLRRDPRAIQIALELDVDAAAMNENALRVAALSTRGLDGVAVRLLKARGRSLPVAAAKFAEELVGAVVA